MTDTPKRGGWRNPASAVNGTSGGRKPVKATAQIGSTIVVNHVAPDGTTRLGRGVVSEVTSSAGQRVLVVPVDDGELRIAIINDL